MAGIMKLPEGSTREKKRKTNDVFFLVCFFIKKKWEKKGTRLFVSDMRLDDFADRWRLHLGGADCVLSD